MDAHKNRSSAIVRRIGILMRQLRHDGWMPDTYQQRQQQQRQQFDPLSTTSSSAYTRIPCPTHAPPGHTEMQNISRAHRSSDGDHGKSSTMDAYFGLLRFFRNYVLPIHYCNRATDINNGVSQQRYGMDVDRTEWLLRTIQRSVSHWIHRCGPSSSSSNSKTPNHFAIQRPGVHVRHLNMIEILIAISIIVTFSGLTGAVFAQIYEDTRVSNAQLDLATIQQALVMYFTRNFRYPLDMEELLEKGDLNKVPKDPWGMDYVYVPHLDWGRLARMLTTRSPNQQQITYYIEAIKRMRNVMSSLPESIEPIVCVNNATHARTMSIHPLTQFCFSHLSANPCPCRRASILFLCR